MIDLKPCPFCGSKGNNIVIFTEERTGGCYSLMRTNGEEFRSIKSINGCKRKLNDIRSSNR